MTNQVEEKNLLLDKNSLEESNTIFNILPKKQTKRTLQEITPINENEKQSKRTFKEIKNNSNILPTNQNEQYLHELLIIDNNTSLFLGCNCLIILIITLSFTLVLPYLAI